MALPIAKLQFFNFARSVSRRKLNVTMSAGSARSPPAVVEEEEETELMDVLLIGAAPARPPPGQRQEIQLRMFNSVQNDLQTMYNLCLKLRGSTLSKVRTRLCVKKCLVNHRQLMPPPPRQDLQLPGSTYDGTQYHSVEELRKEIRSFIEHQGGPNLMIYYSGHGTHEQQVSAQAAAVHVPHTSPLALVATSLPAEEALTIPVPISGKNPSGLESYTASDLTKDINDAMVSRAGGPREPCDAKVYLVIDACHSEGLVNMWQLSPQTRLSDFIVLFAGAQTKLNSDYDGNGGKFTTAFARFLKVGIKLSDLGQKILEEVYDPTKKRSPCVRYGHPSLCDEHFLRSAE